MECHRRKTDHAGLDYHIHVRSQSQPKPEPGGELIEQLAELEHEQWMTWARTLMQSERLSVNRMARWHNSMVPYASLTEENKEHDRTWARKAARLLSSQNVARVLEANECYCGGKNGGHHYACDKFDKSGYVEALEKGNAKLQAALKAQNVGAGEVVVPREPTEEEISAMEMAYLEIIYPDETDFASHPKCREMCKRMYRAAIDAAILAEGKS